MSAAMTSGPGVGGGGGGVAGRPKAGHSACSEAPRTSSGSLQMNTSRALQGRHT
jgi:hypothetical protein